MTNKAKLAELAGPDWMPSARAVVILAIVQAGPRDISELLSECRMHVHAYQPGQCSGAITSLMGDGSIYLRDGRYHLTELPD